jgi:hypothetical protein
MKNITGVILDSFNKIEDIWENDIFNQNVETFNYIYDNLTLRIIQNIEEDIGKEINNEIIQTLIKHERIRRTNSH